jgi:hypothetical protein
MTFAKYSHTSQDTSLIFFKDGEMFPTSHLHFPRHVAIGNLFQYQHSGKSFG